MEFKVAIMFVFLGPNLFLFLVKTEPATLNTLPLGTEVAGMMRYENKYNNYFEIEVLLSTPVLKLECVVFC